MEKFIDMERPDQKYFDFADKFKLWAIVVGIIIVVTAIKNWMKTICWILIGLFKYKYSKTAYTLVIV
jgi:hypothetical protein